MTKHIRVYLIALRALPDIKMPTVIFKEVEYFSERIVSYLDLFTELFLYLMFEKQTAV